MKRIPLQSVVLVSALMVASLPRAQGQFTAVDVGNPTISGSTVSAGGGFNLTGAGSDIGGTNDQFHFNYQEYVGDFDVKVRVESLALSDAWAKAGLLARETLTGGSRYAAAFATPNISGDFFQFRSVTAGQTTNAGSAPATFPNTWLRLERAGSTFTGYASADGNTWLQLGAVTMTSPPLPSSLFVGMAVNSRDASQTTTGQFRGFEDVTNNPPLVTTLPLNREPLGPSSRRSGLAITEIMYHPRHVPGFESRSLEFIEIFNSQSIPEDLSRHRLSGSIDFTFPSNTIIRAGQFLVIARDPVFVQSHYGISGVLGPWVGANTNSLPGGSGLVRLRSAAGAVLLQVRYQGGNPWPVAADGAGHSLVLARPSYGEGDPKAWAASDAIDGSPGRDEPFNVEPLRPIVINEFVAHTESPLQEDFIELYNHSNQSVDLSGAYLTDEASTNKFRIPDGTSIGPRGFVQYPQSTLGFALSAAGERIYLVNSNQNRVIDAVEFGPQIDGVASGRFPDGAPTFSMLSSPTPGAANAAVRISGVVINELMYSPISGRSDDEYVELFNRTASPIDVGGWRLLDGISYTIPINTIIPAGGYLVVANSVTNLLARYSNLNSTNTVGNYGGSLANAGERIALGIPQYVVTTNTNTMVITTNIVYAAVNEVTYGDGGRWGQWSDGGGSSLELIDANSDNRQPSNWADSDESGKSTNWTNVEITGNLGQTLGTANLLLVYQLGVGECLLDDVEVHANNGPNLISNPGFESDFTGWVMLAGSHDHSSIENTGFSGNKSLHIRAGSRGDDSANSVRSPTISGLGTTNITLRAKLKWLRGWPEVLLRIRGGGLEAPGRLVVPSNLGTPGARNSRAVVNAGPAISDVVHAPALPAAGEAIVITARCSDPDGIASVVVKYRIDSTTPPPITPGMFTSVTMADDGTGPDAVAGDGVYSATLPGQAKGTAIGFYIEARDNPATGPQGVNTFPQNVFPTGGLTRCFPYDTFSRECVVRWGDTQMLGSFASYHLWVTLTAAGRWNDRHELCNTPLDGTFVYNNYRVIYNCRPQFAGSPWHASSMTGGPTNNANRVDYVCNFPEDDRFMGVTDTVINTVGNPSTSNDASDRSTQSEQTSYIIFKEMGVHYNYRRYVHMFLNGNQRSVAGNVGSGLTSNYIMEDSQQPNADAIEEWFPDDTNGDFFKIEDWFAFSDTGYNAGNEDADLGRRMNIINGTNVLNPANYRFMWRRRAVGAGESANDYAVFFKMVDAVSPTAAYTELSSNPIPDPAAFEQIADVDQWMRIFACQHAIGNWDSYGYERGKNDFTYKPSRGGFNQMTWDIDFTMGIGGNGAQTDLFSLGADGDRRVLGMWNTPVFRRMYIRAFQDMMAGPWNRSFLDPILDAKAQAFTLNNVSFGATGANSLDTMKTFISQRRDFIQGQITNLVNAPFIYAGTNFINAASNLLVITGIAPVGIKDIYFNGAVYPVTWTSVTGWTARVVLKTGTNVISLEGHDRLGNATTNPVRTLTAVFDGVSPNPQDSIVFSEIMYNPANSDAAFVEIFNRTDFAFDLSGWRINGLSYTFPVGSVIAANQPLALAKNAAAFGAAYSNSVAFAQFDGNLDPDGETLTLFKPGANGGPELVIDQVRYEARLPWPTAANGAGPSLQLIDPNQDNSRPSNWTDRQGWRFYSFTGLMGANATNLQIYLAAAGELYIDNVSIVLGPVAGVGDNQVENGDFESGVMGPWVARGNHSNSALSSAVAYEGNYSLRISSSSAGSTGNLIDHAIPALTSGTNYTFSFWYLPSTNGSGVHFRVVSTFRTLNPVDYRPVYFTPGIPNSVRGVLPAYDPLWLNELQPENLAGPTDNLGEREPWIELYNAGTTTIDLSTYYLANNYDTNLTQWQFPAGAAIGAGELKVIWADGQPGQTAGSLLHTSFRLNAVTGSVALVRLVNAQPQITDYLTYAGVGAGSSYGDYPDGQPFNRVVMRDATPGGTNIARFVNLYINEWLAGNTNNRADPADGRFDDWFEIYNPGTNAIDLGNYLLTDNPGGNTNNYFRVPANGQYVVPAGGFLLVWADNEPLQNAVDRPDLHVSFQLNKNGDNITLYAPDGRTLVDRVDFEQQTDDVTEGRYPDGAGFITVLSAPTPLGPNQLNGANTPPQLAGIAHRTIRLGQTVAFTASASDADQPPQTLTFDLLPGAPSGASIGSANGHFAWTPSPAQAPSTNAITVRVTDNGLPPLNDSKSFTVIVLLPPKATISHNGSGQITLGFDTVPGRSYQVQYKDDLNSAQWLPLGVPVVAAGTSLTAIDNISGHSQRFYRIVQLD